MSAGPFGPGAPATLDFELYAGRRLERGDPIVLPVLVFAWREWPWPSGGPTTLQLLVAVQDHQPRRVLPGLLWWVDADKVRMVTAPAWPAASRHTLDTEQLQQDGAQ